MAISTKNNDVVWVSWKCLGAEVSKELKNHVSIIYAYSINQETRYQAGMFFRDNVTKV
jgi:hypothetical protein